MIDRLVYKSNKKHEFKHHDLKGYYWWDVGWEELTLTLKVVQVTGTGHALSLHSVVSISKFFIDILCILMVLTPCF
jgi:hypothetical protein